jgi:hypothetical protein
MQLNVSSFAFVPARIARCRLEALFSLPRTPFVKGLDATLTEGVRYIKTHLSITCREASLTR